MIPFIISVQSPADWPATRETVTSLVAGRPFSARMVKLREERYRLNDRLRQIACQELLRGWPPSVWRLDNSDLDPPAFANDPATLRTRFLVYGDLWPRARQTAAFQKLGGANADRRVQVWYALFPHTPSPSLAGLKAMGEVARRFPDRWEPRLVRYAFAATFYHDWSYPASFGRKLKVPLAVHREVQADVDAAYRITTGLYGKDAPWNVRLKRELDAARRKAGQ